MFQWYAPRAEITYSLEANIIAHELISILCMGQSAFLELHVTQEQLATVVLPCAIVVLPCSATAPWRQSIEVPLTTVTT